MQCLNRFAFKLRVCSIIVLCLVLPSHTHNLSDYVREISYKAESDWKLANLGRSAEDFLRIFFAYSDEGAVRRALRIGVHKDNMISSLIAFTLMQQIPMTVAMAMGCLIVLLLLLMPFFIRMYRSKQTSELQVPETNSKLIISRRFGCIVYELLIVFLAVSVFGGVLMCVSTFEINDKLPEIFKLATFTVNSTFLFKAVTLDQIEYMSISRTAFEAIQLLYDTNKDIVERYMDEIYSQISPVRFTAQSIQWDAMSIETSLKNIRRNLETLQDTTDSSIADTIKRYNDLLKELTTDFEKENKDEAISSTINMSTLSLEPYEPKNITYDQFDNASQKLEETSKLDLQTRLQNVTHYLRNSIGFSVYDPIKVMEKLRNISFALDIAILDIVARYMSYIDKAFTKEERDAVAKKIESNEQKVYSYFNVIFVLLLICSISSAVIAVAFLVFHTLGVVGTKFFTENQDTSVGVLKSRLSDVSGRVLVIMIYGTVLFLACFWIISIVLFVLSAIPFEICASIKDESLLDMTYDSDFYRSKEGWHSIFSSKDFNMSLKRTLSECQKDPSYFALIPDDIIDESSFDDVKNNLDTETVSDKVEKALEDLPDISINETEMSILDLGELLGLDIHSYFANIRDFIKNVAEKNISSDLSTITNHPKSSDTLKERAKSLETVYDQLLTNASNTVAAEDMLRVSVESTNRTYEILLVQIDAFKITTETLSNFLKENGSKVYMSILNETVFEIVDNVDTTLRTAVFNFRKSISSCPLLSLLKKKLIFVVCDLVLLPVAASWFGSFFVDVYLLISIFLCLYSIPLFLRSPTRTADVPPPVIHPDDIPTKYSGKLSPGSLHEIRLSDKISKSIEQIAVSENKKESDDESSSEEDTNVQEKASSSADKSGSKEASPPTSQQETPASSPSAGKPESKENTSGTVDTESNKSDAVTNIEADKK